METVPFVGAFAQAYRGAESLWRQFRADAISLLALAGALYFSGFRIDLSGLDALSLADLKARLGFLNLLDTDLAKDIGTVTILGAAVAVFAIALQGVMRVVGEICLNVIHPLLPMGWNAVERLTGPNLEAMALWAAKLPPAQRTPERIRNGYREAARLDAEIQERLNDNGWVKYCSERESEAWRIAQNAAAFLIFAWVPARLAAAFPGVLTAGAGGTLLPALLVVFVVAEWHLRRLRTRTRVAREYAINEAMIRAAGWADAAAALRIERAFFIDLAYQASKDPYPQEDPSLRRHLWAGVKRRFGKGPVAEIFRYLAADYRKLRDFAWTFASGRPRGKPGEAQPPAPFHRNDADPRWMRKYLAWRIVRLVDFIVRVGRFSRSMLRRFLLGA